MARKSPWSLAEQRLLIELARASKSLDEAVKVTGRKPESIKKVAMRLGISFKPDATEGQGLGCRLGSRIRRSNPAP
jgi:hypothetical protein